MKTSEIVLDKWQEDVLAEQGNVLLCTGRQVGKTTIFAIKAAKYLVEHPEHQIIVVSLTEDQAKLIIVMTLDYLEKHYKDKIAKGKKKPTQNIIQLKNGARMRARPVGQTGDSVRGFTGNVLYIDEAAGMTPLLWASAKPTLLTTSGIIWMSSTPRGKQGYFWEMFEDKNDRNRFKVFHISSEEVITNRPTTDSYTQQNKDDAIQLLADERADMSELQYGQEYLGLFLDDLRQYFSDALIKKCCTLKRFPYKKDNFMGVDIARMGGDECAYEVLHKHSDKDIVHIENITKSMQVTTKTEEDIIGLNRIWNCHSIGIDAGSGSLGVGIYDNLLNNDETKRKVIAMNNRTIAMDREGKKRQRIFKEDMYDNLLQMMEKGHIKLLNDRDVILSLSSIQMELVETSITSKMKIFGSYSHIAEGLVRAAWLAKKQKVNKLWIACI